MLIFLLKISHFVFLPCSHVCSIVGWSSGMCGARCGQGRSELRHVEGHGDYWLIHQQSKPHVVVHVQLSKTEEEFDKILGWCLGQNHWCEYIEGDLSFLCVIAGFNAAELTPKYPDFISERVYALYDATC